MCRQILIMNIKSCVTISEENQTFIVTLIEQ